MRTGLLSLGLYLLSQLPLWQPLLYAQCSSRAAFRTQLREITAPGIVMDDAKLKPQRIKLEKWLSSWRKCYPREDSSYVDALNQLSLLHYYLAYISDQNYDSAVGYAQEAIRIYKNPKNLALRNSDLVTAYFRAGIAHYDAGASGKAIEALATVIEMGKKEPKAFRLVSATYPYLTFHYYSTGDYGKALRYAEAGGRFNYRVGNDAMTSKILEQKSQALSQLGRHEEAKKAVETAIKLIQKFPEHHRTLTSQERMLAGILYEMGQLDESLPHYHRAYALARKYNDESLSDYATALGGVYHDLGDDVKALGYFQEALRIDRSGFSKSVLLDYMGVLRRQHNDFESALTYHQKGLNHLHIDYHETDVTALPPARLIRSEPHPDYFLIIVQDKADTWLEYAKHRGNDKRKLRNAWQTYMLADSIVDIMRREHSGEVTKLLWRNKVRGMYARAIETCYLLNDPAAALHFFEKSRAVLLNDQLSERIAEQLLTKKDQEGIRRLRRELRASEKRILGKAPSGPNAARLDSRRLEVQERYDKLVVKLEGNNPAYLQSRNNDHVPGLDAIRQSLLTENGDCRSAFLSYFVGDSAIYGICIDADRFVFKKLNKAAYQRSIGTFKESLVSRAAQNSQWKNYLEAAHSLYKTLILPFGLSENTKLIVSPDGDFIPFAAFSLSPAKPDYLVQHHAISYTYSAGFSERVPRTTARWWPSFRTFLGMAPVDFSSTLRQTPLRGSDSTLQEIGGRFLFSKKLTGAHASRKAFAALAPGYRIVQLFTHATADSSGVAPKLYFADSVFHLSDLPDTTFRTQLMVLAACQTGIGKNQRGEGVFSMARGFAAVGIPSTITTLWSVEDQPTYGLTSLFYAQLANDLPLDEALQQAQIEWLKSNDPADQMPYAWAGVVLVGQRAPLGRYYGPWVYGIGVVLLLLLARLFWWAKNRKPIGTFVAPAYQPSPDSP